MRSQGAAARAAASTPAARIARLKERRIESPWKQGTEPERLSLPLQIGEGDFDVAAELPKDLPACAAGRREGFRIGHHGDACETPRPLRDGLEDGNAFGTEGQTVGGVLDITSRVDVPGIVFDGSADPEF